MTSNVILQTVLNIEDGEHGLKYLKIVKSPSGPHYVVDVMFLRGLRLTTDIEPGMSSKNIGEDLDRKLLQYRAGEYDRLKPSVDYISEVAVRALSDYEGKITAKLLHEKLLQEAWDEQRFAVFIRRIDPKKVLSYEQALESLSQVFTPSA